MPRRVRAYSRRRKGYRRAKSMRKRAFKSTRYVKRRGMRSFKQYAHRVVAAGADFKRKDFTNTWNDPEDSKDQMIILTAPIFQGGAADQRQGDKITGHGLLNLNVCVRFNLSAGDETDTALGPVRYRSCRFHFYIYRDMRGATIGTTGAYTAAPVFDNDSVFRKTDMYNFFKWPRDRNIQLVKRKTVIFDLDDDKYKMEERRFSFKFPIQGKVIEWFGPDATNYHKGHYWMGWYMDRIIKDGTGDAVPAQVTANWEVGFTG